jgi:hypothetical protein
MTAKTKTAQQTQLDLTELFNISKKDIALTLAIRAGAPILGICAPALAAGALAGAGAAFLADAKLKPKL